MADSMIRHESLAMGEERAPDPAAADASGSASPSTTALTAGSLGLVLAIFAESMLSPAGMHLVAPSLPLMQAEFMGVAQADILVPMVVTLPGLMIALCAPFMGTLGDRIGVRPLLIGSTLSYIFLGMLPYWLQSLHLIVASRFLFGVAESALAVCGTPLIAAAFAARRRQAVIGGRIAFIGLASMGLALCGGWAATFGWRTAYLLYAFAVVPLILVLAFVPRSVFIVAVEKQEGRQPRQLWAIYGLNVLYGTGIAAVFVYATFLLKELGIHTPKLAGSLSAASSFTTVAAALIYPFVVRRLDARVLVVASFLLMAAGCGMMAVANGTAHVAAGLVLTAAGMGFFIPTTTEMLLQYSLPHRRGQATGLGMMSIYLGNFMVPFAMTATTRSGFTVGNGYSWLSAAYLAAAVGSVVLARTVFVPRAGRAVF